MSERRRFVPWEVEVFRIPGYCWSWGIARHPGHPGLLVVDIGRVGIITRTPSWGRTEA